MFFPISFFNDYFIGISHLNAIIYIYLPFFSMFKTNFQLVGHLGAFLSVRFVFSKVVVWIFNDYFFDIWHLNRIIVSTTFSKF